MAPSIGGRSFTSHIFPAFLAVGPPAILLLVAEVYPGDDWAIGAASVVALAAVRHLVVLRRTRIRPATPVAGDGWELVEASSGLDAAAPQRIARCYLATAGILLAAVALLTPVGLRLFNGWPKNDLKYHVFGPGDKIHIYFHNRIDNMFGLWRGTPRITVLNDDWPPDLILEATGSSAVWGRSVTRTEGGALGITLQFPDDSRLANRTIRLRIEMAVEYPRRIRLEEFTNASTTIDETIELRTADSHAGRAILRGWQTGLVISLGLALLSGAIFMFGGLNGWLAWVAK